MPSAWKTVRIFISSTFRDMHAERDHLVRFVFPELRERCARRRIHLVDVDLRWGVTEEEAEYGRALEVCLDEIERCRPFFVGLLGERYGMVLPRYEVPDEPLYDWVRQLEPGHSITALEIYQGVLRNPAMAGHALFYFRDPGFVDTVPEEQRAAYLPENPEAAEKLQRLKADIRRHCPVCEYAGADEAFGRRVLEDLWAAIGKEYPEEEAPADELAVERAYHEAFIESRSQLFIGRRDLLQRLSDYAVGSDPAPLVVVGSPGSGKSALLANFAKAYGTAHPETLVLAHFIGVSPGSTDLRRTLLRLCRELVQRFSIAEEIPEDYDELRVVFRKVLEQAAARERVLLVVDALNQLDTGYRLDWLPSPLPHGVRVILSALESQGPLVITVGPLGQEERGEIVRQTLADYRKRLDERPGNDQMKLLLGKSESDNPLYLVVACEELRVFGEFERVTQRIAGLPEDVPALFEQVLGRLEGDHGREFVRVALSLLACSRHGLLETEVLELLRREGEVQLPRAIWARLYRSLQFYLRPPGEAGEGALGFFHQQLVEAVRRRYLASEERERAGHRTLADYFRRKADPAGDRTWTGNYPRGLSELPYQQARAAMQSELEATLTDFDFMQARLGAAGIQPLIEDYDLASQTEQEDLRLIQGALRLSAHVVSGDKTQLAGQLMGRLLSFSSPGVQAVLDKAARWRGAPWLRPRTACLTPPGGPLLRTLRGHTDQVHAVATSADGRLAMSGSSDHTLRVWDLESGAELNTLRGHTAAVQAVAMSADGRLAVSSSDDTLRLWDLESGRALRVLHGHRSLAWGVAVSADGRLAVSASADHTLRVWDLENGGELRILRGHRDMVRSVAVSGDGRLAVSASADQTLRLWDVSSGAELNTLHGHVDDIFAVAMSADGRHAISASGDKTLKVWDLESGREVRTLGGHAWGVSAVAVSADGRRAISASDETLKVWDVEGGIELRSMRGHTWSISAVAVSADGRRAVSGSADQTLQVWDLERETRLPTSRRHAGWVNGVSVTVDGRRAISASADRTLKVWDVDRGTEVSTLWGHTWYVNGVAVTADGRRAISSSADCTLRLWDLDAGTEVRIITRRTGAIGGVAVTADGRRAVSPHDYVHNDQFNQGLEVWDVETGVKLHRLAGHSSTVRGVGVSADGRRAISTSDDRTLKVWDVESESELRTLRGHTRQVNDVSMTADGRWAISASEDGTVRVWDIESGTELHTLRAHIAPVTGVAVSSDGMRAASASEDQALKVWEVESGQLIASFSAESRLLSCAITPDGLTVVAGDQAGTVHFLRLEQSGPVVGEPGGGTRNLAKDREGAQNLSRKQERIDPLSREAAETTGCLANEASQSVSTEWSREAPPWLEEAQGPASICAPATWPVRDLMTLSHGSRPVVGKSVAEEATSGPVMELSEHLEELRRLLSVVPICWLAATLLATYLVQGNWLHRVLVCPVYALAVAYPVLAVRLWQFVRPGLRRNERLPVLATLGAIPVAVALLACALWPIDPAWATMLRPRPASGYHSLFSKAAVALAALVWTGCRRLAARPLAPRLVISSLLLLLLIPV